VHINLLLIIFKFQDVSDLPVLLDTANASAIRSGLQANCKTAIINGFSLEPKKLKYILPLAKEFNVDIIGYLLYPNGLSMLMLNIFHDETVQTARLCNTLTRPGIFSWDDIK